MRVQRASLPRVAPAPLPGNFRQGVRSPESYGAGIGEIGTNLATAQVDAIATKAREQADTAFALDAANQLDHQVNVLMFDPANGAMSKKGKDAFGLPDTVLPQFDTFAAGVEAQAHTPEQKLAVARIKSQKRQGLEGSLYSYMNQQFEQYTVDEVNATAENSKNAAIANFSDPRRVALARDGMVGAIDAVGRTLGWGQAQIDARKLKDTTELHAGVIEQYLQADMDTQARAYFEAAKPEIAGDVQGKLGDAIEQTSLRVRSQQESDRIVAEGGSLQEQRDKVKAIADPKLRDETMSRVEHEYDVQQAAEAETKKSGLTALFNAIDRRPSLTDAMRAPVWQTLSGGERESVMSYINARVQGVPVKTDLARWYQLNNLAGDNPQAFAKLNLLADRGKLSESDFQRFSDLQRSIKDGDRAATSRILSGFLSADDVVTDTLTAFGLDPRPTDAEGKKQLAILHLMLDDKAQALEAATGKKAQPQDYRAFMDDILMSATPGKKGGWIPFWNWSKAPAKLFPITSVDQIPPAELEQVKRWLASTFQAPTDANIIAAWLEGKSRK